LAPPGMGGGFGADRGRATRLDPGAARHASAGAHASVMRMAALKEIRIANDRKPRAAPPPARGEAAVTIEGLTLHYGDKPALKGITMSIAAHQVTAFIGPSGCGKTTLLRCLNRMNDFVEGVRIGGRILIGGRDIYGPGIDVTDLRKRVGMVFQKSNPFPKSIYDNVAYGPRILGSRRSGDLDASVERSL